MNVILTQAVEFALQTLGEDNRRRVMAWIDHLKNWENDDFVRQHSHLLDAAESVYVLKTNTEYRIIFRLGKDRIEVLDIVTKTTLLMFRQPAEHGRR